MRRLSELIARSRGRKLLLIEAFLAVALTRVALWIVPLRVVQTLLARRVSERQTDRRASEEITWAVASVARRIPRASCLTQALAAKWLLARNGHDAQMRVGVLREAGNSLRAHAWLELDGRTILGETSEAFVPLQGARGEAAHGVLDQARH